MSLSAQMVDSPRILTACYSLGFQPFKAALRSIGSTALGGSTGWPLAPSYFPAQNIHDHATG
jgi:hypothetical protein